ncbi:MAG: hypothetical protein J0H42_25750 [Rhizobiales bacterium]|nr:hypothetical protein [Hyphomicrobiales bacterium]
MKGMFQNADAKIEVLAHAIAKHGERFTDEFALITIYEGDKQAAEALFNQVVAEFTDQPIQNWLGHR